MELKLEQSQCNIEIKAHVHDIAEVHRRAAEITGKQGIILEQEDIFFESPKGRLKLRILQESEELIYYERPDQTGPKSSEFIKVQRQTGELSGDMRSLLTRCLGVRGNVIKQRTLYLLGETRIHVDVVQGLGDFVELEVPIQKGESVKGEQEANDLMEKLGVKKEDLIATAYLDLLLSQSSAE